MSPTTGIQLKNGILVVPLRFIRFKRNAKGEKTWQTEKTTDFLLYSKDYGESWQQSPMTERNLIADEVVVVEYMDNQVMMNARGGTEYFWNESNNGRRVFVPTKPSSPSIETWEIEGWKTEKKSDGVIYDPICHASLIKASVGNKNVGLFCNPDMLEGNYWPRERLCLRISYDFTHWKKLVQLTPNSYPVWGYSSMANYHENILFTYEDKEKGILFCNLGNIKEIIKNE